MKRISALLAAIVLCCTGVSAQNSYHKGTVAVSMGAGMATNLYFGAKSKVTLPPVSLSVDVCLSDFSSKRSALLVGVFGGTTMGEKLWEDEQSKYEYRDAIMGLRLSYHYALGSKWDSYILGMGGYRLAETYQNDQKISTSRSRLMYGGSIGLCFRPVNWFGIFCEGGYGIAYAQAGLSFKF